MIHDFEKRYDKHTIIGCVWHSVKEKGHLRAALFLYQNDWR